MRHSWLFVLLAFCCPMLLHAQRYDNYQPDNASVSFTQTNLPIVFINVNGTVIQRRSSVQATMKIIDNGAGQLNYKEQDAQQVDYDGDIQLRYEGDYAFTSSDKKPYSILTVNSSGNAESHNLLGMRSCSHWSLMAPFADRSLIRAALCWELARSTMPMMPQARFCELVLDGTYYGVYLLVENPADVVGTSAQALVDVPLGSGYTSTHAPLSKSGAEQSGYSVFYQYTSASSSDVSSQLADFEDSFSSGSPAINETAFMDFLLATELTHNADGYRLNTLLYKDSEDKWAPVLGNADLGYGNFDAYEGYRNDTWTFNNNDILVAEEAPQLIPFYWYDLVHDASFASKVAERWHELRNGAYSDSRVSAKIDSLTQLLTANGAEGRDAEAWPRWGQKVWPNYHVATSYTDETDYLKQWIQKRLAWMDDNIGDLNSQPETYTRVSTPLAISSGFNTDCVAESESVAPTDKSTHPALDGHGSVFTTAAVSGNSRAVPDDGALTSKTGIKYQLADYAADNCLYLPQGGSNGTLTLATPQSVDTLAILLVGTSKGANYDLKYSVTMNYSDGTSTDAGSFTVDDWGSSTNAATDGYYRWRADYNGGALETNTPYYMSEQLIPADKTKQLSSVTLTSECAYDTWIGGGGNDWGQLGFFALSSLTTTTTGIDGVSTPTQRVIKEIWTIDGRKLNSLQHGLNIVRYSDGTVAKIMVR